MPTSLRMGQVDEVIMTNELGVVEHPTLSTLFLVVEFFPVFSFEVSSLPANL